MHSNAALGRKPHTVTGVLVVFTCLNSKWSIALSSAAWERSMSLGLTSTFQNPLEELKNARLSGQKQSYFSEFLKKMTFWKGMIFTPRQCDTAVSFCSAPEQGLSLFASHLFDSAGIWYVFFLHPNKIIASRSVCENSQLPCCFLFMYCLIVINAE